MYSEEVAQELLTEIREGRTLKEACEFEGMPERLEVYDWLRDGSLRFGDRSFAEAYREACQDRVLSVQDEVMELLNAVETGHKTDYYKQKQRNEQAVLKMRWAKDQADALKAHKGVGSAPVVVIRKFSVEVEDAGE